MSDIQRRIDAADERMKEAIFRSDQDAARSARFERDRLIRKRDRMRRADHE